MKGFTMFALYSITMNYEKVFGLQKQKWLRSHRPTNKPQTFF